MRETDAGAPEPKPPRELHLASRSPRRLELLRQLGLAPCVVAADVDESAREGEPAEAYVSRIARAKAHAGWAAVHAEARLPLLAADTSVVVDEQILGKPAGVDVALSMLALLSGRRHQVLTAVTLLAPGGEDGTAPLERQLICRTEVEMCTITVSDALAYWATGEPRDKAGAYAVQGLGAIFVKAIRGSYSNVVGLPLFETAALLREQGIGVLES
jgi:septum formation protein